MSIFHEYVHRLAPEAPSARVVVVSSTAHLGANKELMEGGAWYLKIKRERERERLALKFQKGKLPAVNSHN